MTQTQKRNKNQQHNLRRVKQTGDISIPLLTGTPHHPAEDFSRTIRSYCEWLVAPPFDLFQRVRRRLRPSLKGAPTPEFKTEEYNPGITKMSEKPDTLRLKLPPARHMAAGLAIFAMVLPATVTPALAVISNTVTVTGSSPGNTDDITEPATENVDVEDAAPVLTVTKVATFGAGPTTADGTTDNVGVGTVITYTYTVTNDGNVGVTNVSLSDDHGTDADGTLGTITMGSLTPDGSGAPSTDDSADNDWDYLAPGDMVTWTATYTVTQGDINTQSGDGNGALNNTVTASAGFENSSGSPDTATGTASEAVDLEDVNASLLMAKAATVGGLPVDGTTDNVAVGTTITYTYTITNNGNVPVADITLNDVFNGSGTFTQPNPDASVATLTNNSGGGSSDVSGDSTWDLLAPTDVLTVTTTYVVTQSDVDNLQ